MDEIIRALGDAGRRVAAIEASEGSAGNISVLVGWEVDAPSGFSQIETAASPLACPELTGACFLVTGSGRRLREIGEDPEANLAFVRVVDGDSVEIRSSPRRHFTRPTSEFNSHLAVHREHAQDREVPHTVVHAQPLYLTYLSHIRRYGDWTYLNRHVLRWQPELIIQIPEGIAVLPFLMPGSPELMQATVEAMRSHRIVLWSQHGVMTRSRGSVKKAVDIVEYAETGAKYEYLNLTNHGLAEGLTDDQIRAICATFGVDQRVF